MKLIYLMLVLVVTLSSTRAAEIDEKTFLTVESYPYQQLVRLSDKVLIHYSDVENGVKCRAEVQHNGKTWTSENVVVASEIFRKDALRACFNRGAAKASLTKVFNNR